MKKILILAMVLGLLMGGCAPYLRIGFWVNDNVSYEQFLKDYSECRIKASLPANVIPKLQKDILKCMESKDYYWQTGTPGTLITGDNGWTLLKKK